MTIKEAVLLSLEELGGLQTHNDVLKHINSNKYYDFSNQKTPASTVSALLGDLVRAGDTRLKRVKLKGSIYAYFLTKNESGLDFSKIELYENNAEDETSINSIETYHERDLHILLSSYLKSINTYSRTVFHEHSLNSKDSSQVWIHPDMVGVEFLKLQSNTTSQLLKTIDRQQAITLISYELKKGINSDAELKKAYFQAVSNSSWANFGYLVALEIDSNLDAEMRRLNRSFGIGIIKLEPNHYETKVLYPANYRDLDFQMIDKLNNLNRDFEEFIRNVEKILNAEPKYHDDAFLSFERICDKTIASENEAKEYCLKFNIPWKATGGTETELIEIV